MRARPLILALALGLAGACAQAEVSQSSATGFIVTQRREVNAARKVYEEKRQMQKIGD